MTTIANGDAAIELVGLTKQFGHTTAVKNLSLRVVRGSTFGLIPEPPIDRGVNVRE